MERLKKIKAAVNANLSHLILNSHSNGKTKHPGLHYFNALEWLQFSEMHLRHHLRQKRRIEDFLNIESTENKK